MKRSTSEEVIAPFALASTEALLVLCICDWDMPLEAECGPGESGQEMLTRGAYERLVGWEQAILILFQRAAASSKGPGLQP